jgi:hypothetical protein
MPLTYFDPIEDTSEDPEFLAQDIVEDEEDEEDEDAVDDDDSDEEEIVVGVDDLDPTKEEK